MTVRCRQQKIVGVTNLFRGAMDITRHAGQAPLWRNLASRLLNQTAILVGRVVNEALAAEGTHRYQFAVLATLDAFGAVSQAELCRRTNIDRSDMNAVVNALEAEGTVTRISDTDDRRQNIVEMTETGKARFERLKGGLAKAENRALAPLARADRRELLRLLRILHDYHAVPPPSAEGGG
jgi:DNA-binding MarR family transcriptional regulator